MTVKHDHILRFRPSEVDDGGLVGAKLIAKKLNVAIETIRRWARAGKFPMPYNLNGSIRWRVEEVVRWADMNVLKVKNSSPSSDRVGAGPPGFLRDL